MTGGSTLNSHTCTKKYLFCVSKARELIHRNRLSASGYTKFVAALSFPDARAAVLREVRAGMSSPVLQTAELSACQGRVLAEDIRADRDYPPFNRSMRDGFAVRSADIPGRLRITGEIRAGQTYSGTLTPGEAVEIMTGAPIPEGADAVLMVEHCIRHEDGTVSIERTAEPGSNISPRGCEARGGSVVLRRGVRLDYTAVACLASVGRTSVSVFAGPRVAILATGDELVEVSDTPVGSRIRNSNAVSLAAQVERAGGTPVILAIARDSGEHTRRLIEQGLAADLLLLSGGVSAGKYDVVEPVLADLGATFFFDRVLIQPGQPAVFGRAAGRFFFGLPGNPASTMVTFELFARAAIELLSGVAEPSLPLALARLTQPFRHAPGLTRFLPAVVSCAQVTPVASKGSADIPALCRANAYLVADAHQPEYAAGDLISILFK
jgi:molybdopterin molybdotransferase